jgi:shikimate kinase
MSIILIGYRGSGKTTLGRALAERISWPFLDLDHVITDRAGLSIREIFKQHGEPHFRRLETEHLLESLKLTNHVLSLGGGAVLAEQNRRAIKDAGHPVIYLRADAEELHRRIQADPATAAQRPGLTHLGGNAEEIRQLLALREPVYQQVKTMELHVAGRAVAKLVDELQHAMGGFPLSPGSAGVDPRKAGG